MAGRSNQRSIQLKMAEKAVLMKYFKSLEMAAVDQSWGVQSRLELIPPLSVGLVSIEEQEAAARAGLLHQKLAVAR